MVLYYCLGAVGGMVVDIKRYFIVVNRGLNLKKTGKVEEIEKKMKNSEILHNSVFSFIPVQNK